MQETTPAVETKIETAAPQPAVTPNVTEVDYEAELTRRDEELKKVREEIGHYKRGILKAKGKLPEDDEDNRPKDWREETRQIAREEFLLTREADIQSQKDSLIKEQSRKLKEYQTALKNRPGTSLSAGSNQSRPEVSIDRDLSAEKIAYFKSKGWSDAKIEAYKKNLRSPGIVLTV